MSKIPLLAALALLVSAHASAQPNAWSFAFDPNIAQDPSYVLKQVQTLATGLPGLPTSGIVEVTSGQVKLYFFEDVADALARAKSSGPPQLPPLVRQPTYCVQHAAFTKPTLGTSSSWLCQTAEQQAMAAFEDKKIKTCYHVEFPETYVYEHSPLGYVDFNTVSTWDSLISFAGEALTHVDYPTGLLPSDFMSVTREVISKLRHPTLKTEIASRIKAYANGLAQLQANSPCFDQAALAAFATTVNKLVAELKAVELHLDAVYQAGLAQAAKDVTAIQSQGRKRATLPFPALTDRERELLAFYIGGVYWRMRGEGLVVVPSSGLLRRLLYVQYPYQLIAEFAGGMADAQGVGFNIFVQENWGWGDWFDMGTSPGNDKYADLVDMTIRGKAMADLVGPLLQQRGFDVRPLVAGALEMGPCYYYSWEEMPNFKLGPNLPDPYMQFLECPTANGEFCTGAALALGLVRTLLWGKPCVPDCAGKPPCADNGCSGTCGSCPVDASAPDLDAGAALDGAGLLDGPPPDGPPPDGPPVADGRQDGPPPSETTEASSGCSCSLGATAPGRDCGGVLAFALLLLLLGTFARRRCSRTP